MVIKMSVFLNAKWVWIEDTGIDTYVDFPIEYDFDGSDTVLYASVDGYMSLKVNGEYVPVTQYHDFPFYKSYESIDLSGYSKNGKNTAVLTAWHMGTKHSSCYPAEPGAIFELWQGGKPVLSSGEDTVCRRTPGYKYGQGKVITSQLGISFDFDACDSGDAYSKAVVYERDAKLVKRPIKELVVSKGQRAEFVGKTDEGSYVYDLGSELVGYVKFTLKTEVKQTLTFSWAEHLVEGHARRIVGHRDFSFFYSAKEGVNSFENRMLRFGLRYIEVKNDAPFEMISLEILPVDYPVNVLEFDSESRLIKRIYDTCVHTLRCCMHEHYEDCPWREQSLYALDSRNQMLAGYIAFEEYDYAEKNMLLLAKGADKNGFLPICAPCANELPIPSFSLAYLWSVDEFETYSGRLIDGEIFEAAENIIKAFNKRLDESDNGLINEFPEPFWNFYEWAWDTGAHNIHTDRCSSLLNMMYLIAFDKYVTICQRRGKEPSYPRSDLERFRKTVRTTFRKEDGSYRVKCPLDAVSENEHIPHGNDISSDLSNSYAILSGICTGDEAKDLAERMKNDEFSKTTLSMKGFYYDALYEADPKNSEYIMADICKNYGYMLDHGATTFWETILGAEDFKFAGSLCHGWSAIPIYYIHKFNK